MKNIFNNLSILLVLFIGVLAFSCSDFERENPLDPKAGNYSGGYSQPQVTLCVYEGYGMCESFDGAECPFGGVPATECPYGSPNANSSSSGGGEPAREYGYCVYASVSMCSAKGAYTSCLPSGELSDSCPYGSSSSTIGNNSSSSAGGSSSGGNSSSSKSSSSSGNSSSSSNAGCGSFVEGTLRRHYDKDKPQFCDPRDGKKYVYVTIGTQTWMAENLNYANGGKCGISGTLSLTNDNTTYCDTYGRLYSWTTATGGTSSIANSSGVQGICPAGWHLPSNAEWDVLVGYIHTDKNLGYYASGSSDYAGKYLKTVRDWDTNNGTDTYGFSALGGGYSRSNNYSSVDSYGYWWSTTEYSNNINNAYYRYMVNNNDYIRRDNDKKSDLYSVRCIKN